MPDGELPDLTFRAEDHRYFWRGKPVMNVTRALQLVTDYSKVDPVVLARAQQEGIDMHRMSDLHMKGELHVASLPEWLVPRREALMRFVDETCFFLIASEQRVYHTQYFYAGQLDLVGRLLTARACHETAVIDLKRSFFAGRAIGLQTAAYQAAWNDMVAKRKDASVLNRATPRFALQLRADATYRLEPFPDRSDFSKFLACLTVARMIEERNVQ